MFETPEGCNDHQLQDNSHGLRLTVPYHIYIYTGWYIRAERALDNI